MRIIFCTLFFIFSIFTVSFCQQDSNIVKEKLTQRIAELDKENAVLKTKLDTQISESDKKFALFQPFIAALVTLLLVIYGIGIWRADSIARKTATDEFRKEFARYEKELTDLKTKGDNIIEQLTSFNESLPK